MSAAPRPLCSWLGTSVGKVMIREVGEFGAPRRRPTVAGHGVRRTPVAARWDAVQRQPSPWWEWPCRQGHDADGSRNTEALVVARSVREFGRGADPAHGADVVLRPMILLSWKRTACPVSGAGCWRRRSRVGVPRYPDGARLDSGRATPGQCASSTPAISACRNRGADLEMESHGGNVGFEWGGSLGQL